VTSSTAGKLRITVSGPAADEPGQLRAYAEYRVFTQLAVFADRVRKVRVVLGRSAGDRVTTCVMRAELDGAIRIQATGRNAQPICAIDAAAKTLADAVRNRSERE
jgi:hypothetical protein